MNVNKQALQSVTRITGAGSGDWVVRDLRAQFADRSRYPGHVLRAIRASTTNFKGEIRR